MEIFTKVLQMDIESRIAAMHWSILYLYALWQSIVHVIWSESRIYSQEKVVIIWAYAKFLSFGHFESQNFFLSHLNVSLSHNVSIETINLIGKALIRVIYQIIAEYSRYFLLQKHALPMFFSCHSFSKNYLNSQWCRVDIQISPVKNRLTEDLYLRRYIAQKIRKIQKKDEKINFSTKKKFFLYVHPIYDYVARNVHNFMKFFVKI